MHKEPFKHLNWKKKLQIVKLSINDGFSYVIKVWHETNIYVFLIVVSCTELVTQHFH